MTKPEGGLVTRLVEQEEVARHHRRLALKEERDGTLHHRGEGILQAGMGKKQKNNTKFTGQLK